MALFLLVLGTVVIVDASRLPKSLAQVGVVGPQLVPYLVGSLLCVTALLLALDVLRGGRGEAEAGEDVDVTSPTDWRTVLLLGGAFLANAALIDRIGWPLSGAVLFFGAAFALGSRSFKRDIPIALVMSVGSYLLFARGLGVGLPAGILAGVI